MNTQANTQATTVSRLATVRPWRGKARPSNAIPTLIVWIINNSDVTQNESPAMPNHKIAKIGLGKNTGRQIITFATANVAAVIAISKIITSRHHGCVPPPYHAGGSGGRAYPDRNRPRTLSPSQLCAIGVAASGSSSRRVSVAVSSLA